MKFTFVGTGSAFTLNNFHTNTIIERNGKKLLLDAGSDIRFALKNIDMSYKDLDAVYITHLHGDHCGGLEYLAFTTYFDPSVEEKMSLIGNNNVIRELWKSTLKGGLKSVQGKKMSLDEYFDVQMIKDNGTFYWEDVKFQIVQSIHIIDEFSIVPSFGVMITCPETGKVIYYTGDSQFCPAQIMDFYKMADLIITDCETLPFKSGVHASWLDLKDLPLEIKTKMLLQHYQDVVIDRKGAIVPEWYEKAIAEGFMKVEMTQLATDYWDLDNIEVNGFIPYSTVLDTKVLV